MSVDTSSDKDLGLAYSQRFYDAANQIVTLMYGLHFAVYVTLASSETIRNLLRGPLWKPWTLTGISLLSHGFLIFVLYRLCFHEKRIVRSIDRNEDLSDSIQSACEIRAGMLIFSICLYLLVIWIVYMTKRS